MSLSTHVLDTNSGVPAAGMAVRLDRLSQAGWEPLAAEKTNSDGRITGWGPAVEVPPATYRLVFETADYLTAQGLPVFFPEVAITFVITDGARHHHVPLLLSPYAYSTYRGS
ncbi:hydroxyisourate hydrolase [Allokutzneria sp. A3M-2-11 16]|uniref:hydroxyisourate hydrolase n=1 Tax=Allokutzneria sp. A3M-2-11 16 TaxID=2962043 RepID=UPI0020B86AA5|nr:hydroxyisourate hydrolase [Allokutzneria sp. A3M-2-11 16]MCP3801538.1 hydroxyisourate hydrolase [Allokutzneria sp. A3M-2-11 16]